jgi:hypothetical protein
MTLSFNRCFCFLNRNTGRNKSIVGRRASPILRGRSAEWMAAEHASARVAEPTVTEPMRKGVGQWKPGRMIISAL